MAAGHADDKASYRVYKVEIVYENVVNPSDATVYLIKDAEKFMAEVKKAGINVDLKKIF